MFKAALQFCDSFKIVSDIYRANESNGRVKELAGPNFLKTFKNFTKDYQEIHKVKTMIFCGNKENAKKAVT